MFHSYVSFLVSFFFSLFEILQSLYWAVYGLVDLEHAHLDEPHKLTELIGKLMFGSYSMIAIIILLNLLIAMMSNSYQLIYVRFNTCLFLFNPENVSFVLALQIFTITLGLSSHFHFNYFHMQTSSGLCWPCFISAAWDKSKKCLPHHFLTWENKVLNFSAYYYSFLTITNDDDKLYFNQFSFFPDWSHHNCNEYSKKLFGVAYFKS